MEENVGFELPGMNVKGEYTIQLFDENGELIKEEKKHNCINKILFSTAYYNNIFCGLIDNDSRKTDCYGNQNVNNNVGHVNWLMLTNDSDSLVNDYKNPVVMGEMTGYAHSSDTNSYSDLKRGLINSSETTKINNYVDGSDKKIKSVTKHYVWDFATDKGNGTFDNAYITGVPLKDSNANYNPNDYRGDYYKYMDILINKNNIDNPYCGDSGMISHDNDYIYMQCLFCGKESSNGYQKKCYDTIAKINLNTLSIEYITLQTPNSNAAYIVQGGGVFWRIEYNYVCTRYNLCGEYLDEINLTSIFSSSCINLGSGKNDISHYPTSYSVKYYYSVFTGDDKFLYLGYVDTNMNVYMCVIDKYGTKISELLLGKITDKNYQFFCLNIAYVNNQKFILCSSNRYYNYYGYKVFSIDENGNADETTKDILKYLSESTTTSTAGINSYFISKQGDLFFVRASSNDCYSENLSVAHLTPWTSHVKLDSPITKTSANTMKIQYDITCEYVPVGGIENIE